MDLIDPRLVVKTMQKFVAILIKTILQLANTTLIVFLGAECRFLTTAPSSRVQAKHLKTSDKRQLTVKRARVPNGINPA